MKEQNCTIALDIGTTSLKAVAYLADGTQIADHSIRVETQNGDEGAALQDVSKIYTDVMLALQVLTWKLQSKKIHVAAIGFSSAMHSLVPISEANHPLYEAMIWLDTRPRDEAQSLWARDQGKEIYKATGTPVHAMTPLSKITWIRHTHPEMFHEAHRFVSIKEYIWFQWFGDWEIDVSMAGATGLFDLQTKSWHAPALEEAGIDESQLSTIVSTTYARRAEVNSPLGEIGLSDIPVCIGASDGVLANLAADATEPGTMVLTIGTSLALRTGAPKPAVDVNTRAFCYMLDDDHYIVGGPSNSGGVVLDWLYRNVFTKDGEHFETRFPQLCEDAGEVDAGPLLCVPYLSGERAPVWNESATASFVGMQMHHHQTHFMRAAIEGILFNAFAIGDSLISQVGKPRRLIVSGKLFQQEWVCQFTADLFNIEVYEQEEVDGATLGAAMLANQSAGLEPIKAQTTLGKATKPDQTRGTELREKFERFVHVANSLN